MAVRERDRGAKALLKRMKQRATVKVGVIGQAASAGKAGGKGLTVAEVATYNHFGTSRIPPRPFITQPIDNNEANLRKRLKKVAVLVGKGMSLNQAMDQFGLHVVGLMKEAISNREYEANADATKKRKNSSTPLVGVSGQLRSSITHETDVGRRG